MKITNNSKTLIDKIIYNAEKDPDHLLFYDNKKGITNNEFYNTCQAVASNLTKYHNEPIAIYMSKGIDLIITMMAITMSGNYYTVIDNKMPLERINLILEVLKPVAVITNLDEQISSNMLNLNNLKNNPLNLDELTTINHNIINTNPMYILFTSGSTGIPKGVVVTHHAVMSYLSWFTNCFNINSKTIFGNQTPLYFSMSVSDCLGTIYAGSTLHFIPKSYFSFPLSLLNYLNEFRINTIYWVPSALAILANLKALDEIKLPFLKHVLFAGEVMPSKVLNYWQRHVDAQYANLFGPTETTDICAYYKVDHLIAEDEPIPVGISCENCECLIIKDKQLAKTNEVGEMYVKGSFLASGYFNNPTKTNEVFVQNPLQNAYPEILYKTGDLVKQQDDGLFIYISRADNQIKHMGYRIELEEIENRLYTIDGIVSCVCSYINNFIVLTYVGQITPENLVTLIKNKLPAYMQPSKIIKEESLKHNMNGKIDRQYYAHLERK